MKAATRATLGLCLILSACTGELSGGLYDQGTADGPRPDLRFSDSDAGPGLDQTPPPSDADGAPPPPPPPPPPTGTPSGLQTSSQPVTPCGGNVLCVAAGSGGAENGSASDPYRSISAAVSAASAGDTLQIAGGTYRENVIINNKALTLLGGFDASFTQRVPASNVTTIEGVGGNAAVALLDAGASKLAGLRITKGTGNERQAQYFILGGGIYADGGSPTIEYCLVEDNDNMTAHGNPESRGAGIFLDNAAGTIRFNVVRNNRTGRGAIAISGQSGAVRVEGNSVVDNTSDGDHGGGIYADGPALTIINNYVARNRITWSEGGWGAGILLFEAYTVATLSGNIVTENHATGAGSAFFADDGARATLTNELYFNNVCARDGGTGIYVDGADNGTGSHVTLINSTIANHACQTGNRASVYVEKNSSITIRNSIIWGNGGKDFQIDSGSTLSLTYSITEENVGGNGVLHSDPRFADPTKDFHLKSTAGRWDPAANSGSGAFVKDGQDSPGIDSGDPGDNVASESAPNGSRVNLGAYGRTPQASLSK